MESKTLHGNAGKKNSEKMQFYDVRVAEFSSSFFFCCSVARPIFLCYDILLNGFCECALAVFAAFRIQLQRIIKW